MICQKALIFANCWHSKSISQFVSGGRELIFGTSLDIPLGWLQFKGEASGPIRSDFMNHEVRLENLAPRDYVMSKNEHVPQVGFMGEITGILLGSPPFRKYHIGTYIRESRNWLNCLVYVILWGPLMDCSQIASVHVAIFGGRDTH